MRIAIVINTSWNIFNYRQGLIKALIDKGCEVVAIAPQDPYSSKLEGLGCTFMPLMMDNKGINPFKDALLFIRMFFLYRKLRPDYILHYTIKPNTYGSLAAGILGISCIGNVSGLGTAFIREGLMLRVVKLLYKLALCFPRRVFFQNVDDRDLFLKMNLVAEAKTGLLPGSGINVAAYRSAPYSKRDPFTFVLIARLLVDKGIVEYAMASKLLKEKGLVFEAQIVGFFDRESKYNIAKSDLDTWSEKGYITFLGESEDVRANIGHADCVVLPSYREGTPRSLLEAMAMSKPIIATNVPGCKEVLLESENGFFCEVKNVESLADAMEKMLNASEEKRKKMGEAGRKLVETKFDERIVVEKYLSEIFTKLASN